MLAVIINTTYGRLGAILSALIVVCCIVGLTMHQDFYAGRSRKDFLCFYTNVSNLLVLVYFSLAAPLLYAHTALHPLIPHAEFALMLSIMLTFSVFHLLLFPSIRSRVAQMPRTKVYRIVCTDNFLIHYLVPWMVFLYWLLCSPGKGMLRLFDAFIWTLLPLAYVLCILLRASSGRIIEETQSPYPYPFLDIHALGGKRVFYCCAVLYGICILAGILLVFLTRSVFFLFGGGHALLLI